MARIAVVAAEGILARCEAGYTTVRAANPVPEGGRLLRALSAEYRVAVVTKDEDKASVTEWLKIHGMAESHSYVTPRRPVESGLDVVALRASQLDFLRGCGFSIELVVDPDPAVVHMAMEKGYTALLFAQPFYARPEWRPDSDKGMKAWGAIEAEIEAQATLKAKDRRLTDDSNGRFE